MDVKTLRELVLQRSSDKVKGVGPVVNSDVYEAMINDPEGLDIAQKMNEGTRWWYGSPRNPVIKTSKGNLSSRDVNLITKYAIPSEYTEKLTSKPWSITNYANDMNAEEGIVGPLLDHLLYQSALERADNAARKDRLYKELIDKSGE